MWSELPFSSRDQLLHLQTIRRICPTPAVFLPEADEILQVYHECDHSSFFPVAFPAKTNLLHELCTRGYWSHMAGLVCLTTKFSSAPGRAWNPPREASPLSWPQHLVPASPRAALTGQSRWSWRHAMNLMDVNEFNLNHAPSCIYLVTFTERLGCARPAAGQPEGKTD